MIKTQLVDATNFSALQPIIAKAVATTPFTGLDVETQDDNRHEGLNQHCGYNPQTRRKPDNKPLVFDMKRTVMTGFSLYPEGHDLAYYVNLNHADVVNRVPWAAAKTLLDARGADSYWLAHNANYEMTAFSSCYKFDVTQRMICTLQMAATAYGPDEYTLERFVAAGLGDMEKFRQLLIVLSKDFNPASQEMTPELADVVYKIIGKESSASHSYNGFVKEISHGFGLKKATASWFGHKMTTFQEVLGTKAHMGELTGAEVASYGAEDAYWCVRLFRRLLEYMATNCPKTIDTFLSQENPMVPVFSEIWQNGLKVNTEAIAERRQTERDETSVVLRKMKGIVKGLLPFPTDPHEVMFKTETKWYTKGWQKYRKQIVDWAASPDDIDAYTQVSQIRGAVSNAWRVEKGEKESTGPNFSHYMPVRVLMYDLLQQKVIRSEGKVQSDGGARGRLIDRLGGSELLDCINQLAGIEQRMKLYLTPYSRLMDPDTGHLYPVVSSELASRRMAASYPNPMQLAKRGESTYVRGFFEADYEDHVVCSLDLSGIELVIIGELSNDPEFIKVFGQLPHGDLHSGAAADILSVDAPGLTEESFKFLKQIDRWDQFADRYDFGFKRLTIDLKGQELSADKAYKYWRTEVGKGANFNYWYSGFLATIGERLGWDMTKTSAATDRYKSRFHVAEDWRLNTIAQGQRDGYVTLPDETRRVRYEAMAMWNVQFQDKWYVGDGPELDNYRALIKWIARKIQKRSYNQLVNSLVQGTCATLLKRSIIRIAEENRQRNWDHRICRFMIPIHDEVLFSVHKNYVLDFLPMAKKHMVTHPDIFKHCILDSTPAIGVTFEPWNEKKASFGQIELAEAPRLPFLSADRIGKAMNDNEIAETIKYLFERKAA